jgi:hypothetical protein
MKSDSEILIDFLVRYCFAHDRALVSLSFCFFCHRLNAIVVPMFSVLIMSLMPFSSEGGVSIAADQYCIPTRVNGHTHLQDYLRQPRIELPSAR